MFDGDSLSLSRLMNSNKSDAVGPDLFVRVTVYTRPVVGLLNELDPIFVNREIVSIMLTLFALPVFPLSFFRRMKIVVAH